ncbi:chaoptin-like [Sitodiplosis mosellana]|uniref:chaoptin-like n=1 Tax=Sitodiplosis mosellana TaxID=263140 RepID=UPI0024450841|nr:chaoptin-like [Sitodiplosis mosellana]
MDSDLFSELSDLEVLDLSDNEIGAIPEDAFKKNSKLKTLNLKNNPIWRLDCSITQLLNGMTSINVSFENVIGFDLTCATPIEWAMNEEEIIFKNANNQNELRYPKMKFKNLRTLSIWRNRLHNSLEIVDMLGESIEDLNLNGNILGKIDETTFHGFNNLHSLYLSETNLSFAAESNPFEHLNKLTHLDISHNNLTSLNVSLLSKTLSNLEIFLAAGNRFDNSLGIIQSLGSNLLLLHFSQNIIGALNLSTFERFIDMSWLNLSDTHLEHFDVNPLKVSTLDISRNKLKRLNVNLLSDTLNRLHEFCAAGNYFENTAEIIQHLGSNLNELDISGNYMGTLNETTFEQTQNIQRLWLRRTNLSISDVKPFETLAIVLKYLDISNNNLTQLNFSTSLVFENLKVIYLRENHLTQLDGLFKHSYPKLTELDITNNQLNCTTYLSMVRTEWESLNIIGNPCGDEDRTQSTTIAPKTSVPPSSSIVSYAVPIGVSALNIIIIVAVVVFLRRKKSSKSSGQMEVSNHSNGNGEELQPEPQQEVESNPEDHIYEEIEEPECPYDHLEFGVRPMPISTENQHYQNFTLVNLDRGTRPQNNGENRRFLDGRREMLPIYNESTQD